MLDIKTVADKADVIINGYAFTRKDDCIHVLNLNSPKKAVVFNVYELNGSNVCPECKRQLDKRDFQLLDEIGKRSCVKCGAVLKK